MSAVASVTAGHAFAVHAAVIAGVGRKVTFQHRLVGGKWHSDGTFLTGSNAHVGRAYKTLPAGKYQFRAVLRAKGSHKAVASHLVTVTVTAAPPPAATFALPGAGNENVAIPFTYSVTNAPSGATVVLQRQQGTAEAWGTVLTLPVSGAGSASAPGVAMGQYWYRIELLATGGAVLALDQSIITVFGNVPPAALIGGDTSRTVISGGHTLPYVSSDNYDSKVISTTLSVCQSLHLDLARADSSPSAVEQVTVVQQTADPVSVTVPNNGVVSLDANLVPGQSFAVNIAAPGNSSAYVYFNGYGSCYASRLT